VATTQTTRQRIASAIEDIIWKNVCVHDDSGLHFGDAVEEIMALIDQYLPADDTPTATEN